MIRIMFDPAPHEGGGMDSPLLATTIIEQEIIRQIGVGNATVNATRRGSRIQTESEKEHQLKTWAPDYVIPVSVGKRAKAAVAGVVVKAVEFPKGASRQEVEDICTPYRKGAQEVVDELKKLGAKKFTQRFPTQLLDPVETDEKEVAPDTGEEAE